MVGESMNIKEALSHLRDFQHVVVGTVDIYKPRIRPMTLVYLDKRFWLITDTKSAKVRQIQNNPNIEFCLLFTEDGLDCCLRFSGVVGIIKDNKSRVKIANHCDFFNKHWENADDPNFTLLEVYPKEIQYVKPNKITRMKFSL